MKTHGTLVISLDFELYWGVHDVMSIEEYRENLLGVREALPRMLEMFAEYDIHVTWATVGFLFFMTREELLNGLPARKPNYNNDGYSPYGKLRSIGKNESEDPFHFAPSLIKYIRNYPNQELGTHTFSHYYCLESGQNKEEFEADLKAAVDTAEKWDCSFRSIVFPRNQVNDEYLKVCEKYGLIAYRGTELHPVYRENSFSNHQNIVKRFIRIVDAYMNLTGYHIYDAENLQTEPLINIPSSRFLRPFTPSLKFLEPLRLRRITKSMTKAAKRKKIFHLWWHPHNFGKNIDENMSFLKNILEHYRLLQERYDMKSLNMGEMAELISNCSFQKVNEKTSIQGVFQRNRGGVEKIKKIGLKNGFAFLFIDMLDYISFVFI